MFKQTASLAMAALGLHRDMLAFEPISIGSGSIQPAMTGHANNGASRFDPRINRHTGKPHEHRREIARNLARAA